MLVKVGKAIARSWSPGTLGGVEELLLRRTSCGDRLVKVRKAIARSWSPGTLGGVEELQLRRVSCGG